MSTFQVKKQDPLRLQDQKDYQVTDHTQFLQIIYSSHFAPVAATAAP